MDAQLDRAAVLRDGMRAERVRRSAIGQLFEIADEPGRFTELRDRMLDEGSTVDDAREALAEAKRARAAADDIHRQATSTPRETHSGDGAPNLRRAMSDALEFRSNMRKIGTPEYKDLEKRLEGNQYRSYTLVDMARHCLESDGHRTMGMSKEAIIDAVLTRDINSPINQDTADFPNLLADQVNKNLLLGWIEAEETYNMWIQSSSASDFKTGSRVHLSNFSNLATVLEGAEYQEGNVADFAEPFTLKTVGRLWSVTRQALVNDDLQGLTRVPQAMGRAAARSVGDDVYAILTGNPNMSDANPLFDALHSNTTALAAGAPPTIDTIDAGRVAMALQTDNNPDTPVTLGLRPRYLIVPLELESDALVLATSTVNPDAGVTGVPNPVAMQGLRVVSDHRLSSASAVEWYLAGSMDTVEVVYLNGQQAPMLESQNNFSRDGVHYKVRLDYTTLPVDWRSLYRDLGV